MVIYSNESVEMALRFNNCVQCGEKAAMMCSKCKTASYCSSICQRANWPLHKQRCKELTAQQPTDILRRYKHFTTETKRHHESITGDVNLYRIEMRPTSSRLVKKSVQELMFDGYNGFSVRFFDEESRFAR